MLLVWLLRIASAVLLVFWLAVVADRRRAWPGEVTLRLSPTGGPPPGPGREDTAVVVPARNERLALETTLPALLKQAGDFHRLILVDDRSEDGTAERARELAAESEAADRVDVLAGRPPPGGWSGKVYALAQAVRHVVGSAPETIRWFLFTDADIEHPPGSLRALRQKAEDGPYDQVSVMVRLRARSFWEKLLIPPFVYFFQLLYPFRRVADPSSRVAAAAGGCVLIRRDLLERLGGLESIRGAVIDDVALARCARAAGGRLWLGLSAEVVSLRAYPRFGDVAAMVSRTAFTQLKYSLALLFLTTCAMILFLISPPCLVLAGGWLALPDVVGAAAVAWGMGSWTLLPAVRHHRVHALFAFTLPLSSALYLGMTWLSAWKHWCGHGTRWRGRSLGSLAEKP